MRKNVSRVPRPHTLLSHKEKSVIDRDGAVGFKWGRDEGKLILFFSPQNTCNVNIIM